jgi:3-hydroxyacyl-CoA dehydrogenase/enoyl-CoA hydratase/3-hydroxybutyryl-CoA epimerase
MKMPKGIVINSAKRFYSWWRFKVVLNYDKSKEECFDMMQTNTYFREMESCGKPVVAAINGLALVVVVKSHWLVITEL